MPTTLQITQDGKRLYDSFNELKTLKAIFYPGWLCEELINELEELITSGEKSEARERLSEILEDGPHCETCAELMAAK